MSSLSNITSLAFLNRIGLSSKKIVHRMVFVRHGETIANINIMNNCFDPTKKHLNTPLSELGHIQSKEVADFLDMIGFVPDEILISRLDRAIDTAKPYIDNHNIPVIYSQALAEYNYSQDQEINVNDGSWLYKKETKTEFIERVTNEFANLKTQGSTEKPKQTLIYTHSQVISGVLTNGIFGTLFETSAFFHLSNCSITCIDIDEDRRIHIHTVNYTKHLTNPTGHHSSFI